MPIEPDPDEGKIVVDGDPPAAPILNTISPDPDTDGSIYLQWGSVSGANGYQAFMINNIGEVIFLSTITSGTSYTKDGLLDGSYQFKVRAYNAYGSSTFSNIRSVTVSIPADPDPDPDPVDPIDPSIDLNPTSLSVMGEIAEAFDEISLAFFALRDSFTSFGMTLGVETQQIGVKLESSVNSIKDKVENLTIKFKTMGTNLANIFSS